MLPTTETWRQCAAMLSSASDDALRSAVAAAVDTLESDGPIDGTACDGTVDVYNMMLASALRFLFGQLCAACVEDSDAVRQFLASCHVCIASHITDVIADAWVKHGHHILACARRRAIADFCRSDGSAHTATSEPLLLASRSRVVVVEGGIDVIGGAHRVESLLSLPATTMCPGGVDVTVDHDEAYALFCELDGLQARLDALLAHPQ
ncbi:hypothetical protein DQ04_09161030 [Trypanosoma grayi]|uniref:hypothetical protein n=1 Tax=Trypanosoma grayi TaxID=71804 RepID=UPI0004F40EBC|nr:hypothetical protein DQ04_09161030 [Trypanosoma grayi]KEG07660.1 hypothetical protein DQ04_09161030 [Trypanosoma grayi]